MLTPTERERRAERVDNACLGTITFLTIAALLLLESLFAFGCAPASTHAGAIGATTTTPYVLPGPPVRDVDGYFLRASGAVVDGYDIGD